MNEKEPPKEKMPKEIMDKMRQWRQANPKATLTEIEERVDAELAGIRGQLVAEMAQERAVTDQGVAECPECGQEMVKNGRRKRKLKTKEGQTIELKRQQWRCLSCGTTLFPPG